MEFEDSEMKKDSAQFPLPNNLYTRDEFDMQSASYIY